MSAAFPVNETTHRILTRAGTINGDKLVLVPGIAPRSGLTRIELLRNGHVASVNAPAGTTHAL